MIVVISLLLLTLLDASASIAASFDSDGVIREMRASVSARQSASRARLNALLDDAAHVNASLPMSSLLGLHVDEEIAVRQHVNVLLVGVARARVHYTAAAVEPWFRHIAHALPHVLAPVGAAQTTTEKVQTPRTQLAFNVSVSFVELAPRVASVLEEVLMRHIRAESKLCASPDAADAAAADRCNVHRTVLGDPDLGTERYYVDAARFSAVLADLTASLGLDRAFSLFVLNLKAPVDKEHATYGYRVGFAPAEIAELRANTSALSLPQTAHTPKRWSESGAAAAAASKAPPLTSTPPRFVSKVAESDAWANRITEVLFKARALRAFEIGTAAERATAEASFGVAELRRLANVCAEIDPDDLVCVLRAEPAAHGSTFDMVAELAALGTVDERRYVQQLLRDHSGLIRGDCLVDAWVSHERLAFVDLGAGPLDWGPTVAAQGVKTYESFPRMPADDVVERELSSNASQRRPLPSRFASEREAFAESSLLAVYRNLHCFYGADSVCAQLADRVQQLQSAPLQQLPWLARASRDADSTDDATSPSEDEFLSELAHVVLGIGVRQVFLPPASLYAPVLDRAVSFHLFVVSDHDAYAAVDELTFDWQRVRGELQALRLPYQSFGFRVTTVSLSDEPRIIAALAASLRSATLPSLDAEGQFHAVPSRYIDSAALQERLLALHVDGDSHGVGVDPTRHINLFLFSIGDETPLLFDKYFQAKALDDTVLIVQSNARNFSSRFACNGALIDVDLRNPTHAALGALGTLLGGLVPAHIQYEPTRGAASQDWRWAVGARPNIAMPMAPLARYGALTRDIALRNAAMAAVTESLTRLQAIERALNERKLSVALGSLSMVRPALTELAGQVGTWLGAVDFVVERLSEMRFDDAVVAARELRDTLFAVDAKVTQLSEGYDRLTCAENTQKLSKAAADTRRALAEQRERQPDNADIPQLPLPRGTPAIALPLVPWRSSAISVMLIAQLALVLGYATWRFWTAGAHARNKVKVN